MEPIRWLFYELGLYLARHCAHHRTRVEIVLVENKATFEMDQLDLRNVSRGRLLVVPSARKVALDKGESH